MAGRIKHMERSHRSYGKNYSEFNRFEMRASSNKYAKESRKSLTEKIADGFKNIFKRQKKGDK